MLPKGCWASDGANNTHALVTIAPTQPSYLCTRHRRPHPQADATCTEADVANITAVGMPVSLADRSRLIRMLEVTTRGCVRCILQTVASVCGDDCAKDRLHIRTGRKRLPYFRVAQRWRFLPIGR
jgi:hypothetical protein